MDIEKDGFITELFNISGKIALITGSSRGLGFTLAKGFSQAGGTVILNGSDAVRCSKGC